VRQTLDPAGRPVRVGRAALRTPGLAGEIDVAEPDTVGGVRSSDDFSAALRKAIDDADARPLETYRIANAHEVAEPPSGSRSTAAGDPAMELDLPVLAAGWEQVVLAVDEGGVATWHRPEPAANGASTQRYRVRGHVPTTVTPGTRGIAGAVGVKIGCLGLADPVHRRAADHFLVDGEPFEELLQALVLVQRRRRGPGVDHPGLEARPAVILRMSMVGMVK